jgi:hypothetical protein
MAKAISLTDDILAEPSTPPRASARPAKVKEAPPPAEPPKEPTVPLQIRIGARDLKAIKRAALEADQTVSDFILACFHAHMKRGQKA